MLLLLLSFYAVKTSCETEHELSSTIV